MPHLKGVLISIAHIGTQNSRLAWTPALRFIAPSLILLLVFLSFKNLIPESVCFQFWKIDKNQASAL